MTTRAELDAEWEKLRKARAEFEAEREASGIEHKLFVGNLDQSTTDEELSEMFAAFGTVKEACVIRDRERKSKRSGFVKYYSKANANAAIAGMHDRVTDKSARSPLAVRFARPKAAPPAEQFGNSFAQPSYSPYGQMQQMGQMGQGYGLGQYAQPQANPYSPSPSYQQTPAQPSYQDPYAQLGQQAALSGYGQQAQTPQYAPASSFGGGGMGGGARAGRGPPGSNLYVNNIDRMATEQDVRAMFSEFGTVISCKLFSDNGYGFVSYDNPTSAQNAIQCLNGMQAADGSRQLEVSLKKEKSQSGGGRYAPY